MTATWFINGKFTAQPTTGVQRVANRLVRALDAQPGGPPVRWVLLHPPGGEPPPLRHIECRPVGRPGEALHLWEQWRLPRAARGGALLSLAGSAPWRAADATCMVHDAAVFDHPEAYSRPFVLWYRALFRHLARSGARLLTVSAFSRERLAAALRLPQQRIGVVTSGADHLQDVQPDAEVLARHGLVPGRYLLAVGSANPTKNLDRLVQAFGTLALPGAKPWRLVIVGGRNPRVFSGDALAADPPQVVRTGPLGDAALKALYASARTLVFPSIYEGFGIPPLEAMACGCPVLAARAASIPEVCGDAALYFDPHRVDDIARALRQALQDDAMLVRLRQAGAAQVARYTWAGAAAQLQRTLAVGTAA